MVVPAQAKKSGGTPLALAILTDLHFWVPFLVLLLGIVVLVVCART